MRIVLLILLLCALKLSAQTLGGNAVFNFLNQPNTAHLSSIGGVNNSSISNDLGMAFHNPSLLRNGMHQQISTSFFSFAEGVKQIGLNGAWHVKKMETNAAFGVQFVDYGTITQTDPSGNVLGYFKPVDYVVQLSLSRNYHENWWYGLTTKFVSSNYGQYRSSGIAFDMGVAYYDEANKWQASIVAKNMGTQLKTYDASQPKEELPFDLQAGISKRLLKAPFQFSLTAHHLHRLNILYSDSSFNASEGNDATKENSVTQQVLSHLVFSTEIFLSDKLQVNAGLNLLRRQSLNAYYSTNGLNGFTFGFALLLDKLHARYATGFYQQNLFHQFSLNFNLKGDPL